VETAEKWVSEGVTAGDTLRRIESQELTQEIGSIWREESGSVEGDYQISGAHTTGEFWEAFIAERMLAGEKLVHHHTDRPHIGFLVKD
jgi:hypothetical protein